MTDEGSEAEIKGIEKEQGDAGCLPIAFDSVLNVEKVDLIEKSQCNSASLPNSPVLPLDGIL